MAGKPVPVYRGYSEPLIRKSIICPEIHGESGLGGLDWSVIDPSIMTSIHPISEFFPALKSEILANSDTQGRRFTIVTTAAMTNIAMFLKANPELAQRIRVVSMAGNFKTIGNIGAWSEFNVLVDPEAFAFVLERVHVTFIPLDVTHTVLFTEEIEKRVQALQNQVFAKTIINLLSFFKKTYKDVFGFESPPLHDPLAIFYVACPNAFQTVDVNVQIETKGEYTYGACCADWYRQTGRKENATVCLKVDVNAFWDAMLAALAKCAENGGLK